MEASAKQLAGLFEDPENLKSVMAKAKEELSVDTYSKLEEVLRRRSKLQQHRRGSGFVGVIASTWEDNTGKAMIVLSGIGVTVTLSLLLEGLGAATGWGGIRVLKKLSQWYAGAGGTWPDGESG